MKKAIVFFAAAIFMIACKKNDDPVRIKPLVDIDGNRYDTVKIGQQFWMKENLRVSHYRNGDLIPEVTSPTVWASLTTGAWCWYNNDSAAYAATYGKLYNWYAVNDPRGLAPAGWHVPSDGEWTILTTFLGGLSVAGGALKETGTLHWSTPNTDASNTSGFTALPGGGRNNVGNFSLINISALFRTSTYNAALPYIRSLNYNAGAIGRGGSATESGYSVRCTRD